jgi:hypothetical protein
MTPLAKKLHLKPHERVLELNAPTEFRTLLEPLPEGATIDTAAVEGVEYDAVYFFANSAGQATELAKAALGAIRHDGSFWTSWPKDNARRKRDLTRDSGWDALYQAGLTPVASVSINDGWSALRWRPVERVGSTKRGAS